MKKLNDIVCDKCRIVCTNDYIEIKGKKRTMQYCLSCGRTKEDIALIDTFGDRLAKIGIDIEFCSNVPWVYIDKINGKKVTETFQGEHGFTVAFFPVSLKQKAHFTDITEIFKLIRKYL